MKLDQLSKAFALAHKLSESDKIEQPNRNYYRAIAYLIWDGLGEPGKPEGYATTPEELQAERDALSDEDRAKLDTLPATGK